MKEQASYDMDGESRDLLLFDYLEGNLTEARARELEAALACDQELQAELESWKESFVVQDFYPTAALEAQLLSLKPKPFSFFGPAAGFLLVLVTSLFSFLPVGDAPERGFAASHMPATTSATGAGKAEEQALVAQETAALVKKMIHTSADKQVKVTAVAESSNIPEEAPEEAAEIVLPDLEQLSPATGAPIYQKDILTVEVKKLKLRKTFEPRQISRKQQRQINRMKEKALQQKKANQFLKGNKPYVVPLDTENF